MHYVAVRSKARESTSTGDARTYIQEEERLPILQSRLDILVKDQVVNIGVNPSSETYLCELSFDNTSGQN